MADQLTEDETLEGTDTMMGRRASHSLPLIDRRVGVRGGSATSGTWALPPSQSSARDYAPSYAPSHAPSYAPTGIPVADRLLAYIDEITGGKADWLQRLVTYLAVGGFGALVNLLVYGLLADGAHAPFLVAELFASEISILTNFSLNDRITFRRLPGHKRSWSVRCLRFHMTAVGGALVTICVSFTLLHFGLPKLVAQACAIVIALAFNFTFHHLFTYRHARA